MAYGVAASAVVVVVSGPGALRSVPCVALLAGSWLLGLAVTPAVRRVEARRAEADALERRGHTRLADGVVGRERSRILTGSLEVVQDAVESMRADAAAAADDLDPVRLDRVGTRGEQAIADLRRILGLLRGGEHRESPLDGPLRQFVESDPTPAGSRWRAVLADVAGNASRSRVVAAAAVLALGGSLALAALDDPALPPATAALAVLAVGVPAAWSRTRVARAQRAADARLALAQEALASRLEDAVTADRFRLARELHDITSHSVGAMVLQARAASALSTRDPDSARRSVANALLAGDQALAELDGPVTRPVVQDPVTPPAGTQDPTPPVPPVASLAPSKVTVKAKAGRAQGRHRKVVLTVTVKATGQHPTGTVSVRRGGKVVGTGRVGANGVVKIVLKKQPRKTTSYTVQYGGSAAVAASSTKVKVRARR